MSKRRKIVRRYVQHRIQELERASRHLDRVSARVADLRESVTLDLIDGWTTGDDLADFALVATQGVRDEALMFDYHWLAAVADRYAGQQVLVIQQSEHWSETDVYVLQNMYLATLVAGPLMVNTDKQELELHVKAPYLLYREYLHGEQVSGVYSFVESDRLVFGPLYNEFTPFGYAKKNEHGVYATSLESPSVVAVSPWDVEFLHGEYGVTREHLSTMHAHTVRYLSRAR